MEAYRVNIQGLSNKIHHFEYQIGEPFFRQFETGLVSNGNIMANVSLDKHETFIEAHFILTGTIRLQCDRSLDEFDYPVNIDKRIIFKFGHEAAEVSDEVLVIDFNTVFIELGQFMYEFIELDVPMKKLHPRFQQDETEEDEIIYSSDAETKNDEPDPRWEKLKNLNKNK